MLISMAYLDQILPVSSTVEAVEVTRRVSICGPGLAKTLPTDVASPCVHCFREAGSCVSVPHSYFSCMCMYMYSIMYTHELTHAEHYLLMLDVDCETSRRRVMYTHPPCWGLAL